MVATILKLIVLSKQKRLSLKTKTRFGIEKCAVLAMKRGKVVKCEGTEERKVSFKC